MESLSQLDPNEWNLKGNRPRKISDFSFYPKEFYDGKPFYALYISNGDEGQYHYLRNPVVVAHMMKAARKKRHLSFLYLTHIRSREDGTSLSDYHSQSKRLKSMGTINWLPYEKRWRRWNKWKGRKR